MTLPANYFGGLSGLELPVPKYQFPEEHQNSSRLAYYSTFFNSIEVNSSFYKIPMKRTVAKWAASVPENFRFTFKLSKEITHCKDLQFNPADIYRFIDTISEIGSKRGCLLIQFPPGLKTDTTSQLEHLLEHIRNADANNLWKTVVEFRNRAWYNDDVYDILKTYNTSLVRQDIPKSATPFNAPLNDVVYMRFHGPTGNYDGSYSEEFLAESAEYVREWIQEGKKVYVYFNNTKGDAFNNLTTFNRAFLGERS